MSALRFALFALIYLGAGLAQGQTEIIVDNSGAGYSETGFWVTGTFSPGYYGPNYDHNNGCSSCSDTATWTYTAPAAGAYSVYAWWPATSNRATNATYTVNSASGATPVAVNQQINGSQWNLLGTFSLNQGTNTVTLSAQGNGSVVADAIRVVSPAFAVSVNPIADAFTSSAFPNISFGGGNTISLWNTPQVWGYLKFDVQTLPANATAVTLRLRGSGSTTTTVNAYPVSDTTWGETTITWNNKPSTGATPIASASVGTTDQWYSWDITAYVQSERAAGHNLISIALKTASGGSGQSWVFSSREGANPPELAAQALAPLAALYSVHVDHLNTPRAVYDASQQLRWKWDQLEPFGDNAPDENPGGLGTLAFPVRFPGQYQDLETNLAYNYFRDYDPTLGRYVRGDPIGLSAGMNVYGYVAANPLGSDDRFGLAPTACCAPKSAEACCAEWMNMADPNEAGTIVCCAGKPIACVRPSVGGLGEGGRIIWHCVNRHEQVHIKQDPQCTGCDTTQARTLGSVAERQAKECEAYRAELACLRNKVNTCKTALCRQAVTAEIANVMEIARRGYGCAMQ